MRGFGVTRRRGTETGGLLIGKIDRRTQAVIHIQEYEVVPCEYASGPSYVLSAIDKQKFQDAVAKWQPSLERELYAVGYFRSHTREGFSFDEKDAALFREFFRDPNDVALLIKPFATRSATAGFFLQDNGSLAIAESPSEFTFAPPGKRDFEAHEPLVPAPEPSAKPASTPPARPKIIERTAPSAAYERPMFSQHPEETPAWRRRLSWMAFSVALLAFGAVCGFEYGTVKAQKQSAAATPTGTTSGGAGAAKTGPADQYSVQLGVTKADTNLLVKWNRDAAPIQAALHGLLTVTEGTNSKEVKLGFAELRNGTAMYPHAGQEVTFRLELFFNDSRSFTESAEFKPAP